MRFPPVEMLAWAKEATAEARCHIGRSGMPAPPRDLFGDALDHLPFEGRDERGDPEVQGLVAARFGVDPTEVMLAPGTTGANFFVAAGLVDGAVGDEIVVEEPTYGPLLQLAQVLTPHVRRFKRPASAAWQPDLDGLRNVLGPRTRLVVVTNLHNPSGALIDAEAMARLAALVEEHSPAHLLVDEVYLEMVDDERACAYRPGRRVVTTRSLTKAYGLNWLRSGMIVGPAPALARARDVRDYVNVIDNFPATAIIAAALRRMPVLRERLRLALAESEAAYRPFFAGRDDLDVVWPHKPFLFFPRVKRGVSTAELALRLRREHGVAVVPGELFGAPGHIRTGAIGRPDLLQVGLPALGAFLDTLPR